MPLRLIYWSIAVMDGRKAKKAVLDLGAGPAI